MNRCPKLFICALALAGLHWMSAPAVADSLTPGSIINGPLTSFNPAAQFTGVVADTGIVAFATHNAQGQTIATGTVREQVGHFNGSSNLAFLYQFSVNPAGAPPQNGGVAQFSVSNYDSFTTSVFQSQLGPVGVGTIAQSSVNRSVNGNVIDANYIPEIIGATAFAILIDTNAPNFQAGSIALQDSGNALVAGFAPTVNAPEPASMMIFATSLLGLGGVNLSRRFRARKAVV